MIEKKKNTIYLLDIFKVNCLDRFSDGQPYGIDQSDLSTYAICFSPERSSKTKAKENKSCLVFFSPSSSRPCDSINNPNYSTSLITNVVVLQRIGARLFRKNKTPPVSDASSAPSSDSSAIHQLTQAAAAVAAPVPRPITPPLTAIPADVSAVFMEAYDCAKNNHNWIKVSSAVSDHPDWLTKIPQGRRWTMLHQVVYCGDVTHLNEVLAFQISNEEFRLLCKALDDKTVREVAAERAHVNPQMLRRVERLVAIDQLLNNAKDGKWELVRQFLRQQPDIINEKPPYRKYYLAHYLALTGQLDMFKDLSHICQFKLDLIVDDKTMNQIARENNYIGFAEHIEGLQSTINDSIGASNHDADGDNGNNNDDDETTENDSTLPYPTTQTFFTQGFDDDPGIMIFSINTSNMFSPPGDTLPYPNHHPPSNDLHFTTHSLFQGESPLMAIFSSEYPPQPGTNNDQDQDSEMNKKSKSLPAPSMTDDEQIDYEKTVIENIKKFSADSLLNAVTCCITRGILRDPVVAADGFTYEREAITSWFEHSNRSPMTNQVLENQELKPNHAIKSILKSLAETKKEEKPKNHSNSEML